MGLNLDHQSLLKILAGEDGSNYKIGESWSTFYLLLLSLCLPKLQQILAQMFIGFFAASMTGYPCRLP